MRLHRRRRRRCHRFDPQIGRRLRHVVAAGAADDERPAVEVRTARIEGLLGDVELRVLQAIAKRQQRGIRVVVDEIHRAGAGHAPRRSHGAFDRLHRRVEHFRIGHARDVHVEHFGEGPPRVVVRLPLRIVRRPVLIVEQRVRDPAEWLIHADDVRAGGEGMTFRRRTIAAAAAAAALRRRLRLVARTLSRGGRRTAFAAALRGALHGYRDRERLRRA